MWQDLKHLSPQVAALYMAGESDHALRSQQRPEDVVEAKAVVLDLAGARRPGDLKAAIARFMYEP